MAKSAQAILGKDVGDRTPEEQALQNMAVLRSGVLESKRYNIPGSGTEIDLATEDEGSGTQVPIDGETTEKAFTKFKRAYYMTLRFDKDIILRLNGGDPQKLLIAEGGIYEEGNMEINQVEIKTTTVTTVVKVRLS